MGQVCACLQPCHRKKRERRLSDASTEPPDYDSSLNGEYGDDGFSSDGDEIHILIDGGGGSGESDSLLAAGQRATVMTKRSSAKSMLQRTQAMTTETTTVTEGGDGGNGTKIMGDQQANPLSDEEQRRNMDVLRSYQKVTGVVDPGQLDLECVMCLDTFSNDNPKIRTLCSCGMNRTNFHLSCLLEWLNRDANCPVCRKYLFYEEP